MTRSPCLHRLAASALALAMAFSLSAPAFAAEEDAPQGSLLLFRPHCEKEDQKQCAFFKIEDPSSLATPTLKVGDTLDMDVVIVNPQKMPIRRVRSWLAYDNKVLEGTEITMGESFPIVTPGENAFAAPSGYAKIAASTKAGTNVEDEIIAVARVQFKVKSVPKGNKVPITFYDVKEELNGHTYVSGGEGEASNILTGPMASLVVHIAKEATKTPPMLPGSNDPTIPPVKGPSVSSAAASESSVEISSASASSELHSAAAPSNFSSSSVASSKSSSSLTSSVSSTSSAASSAFSSSAFGMMSSASSQSSVAPVSTVAFPILQVQNVRIATDSNNVYLTWDRVSSNQVQAYNIYFGDTMGRYIHRRTVSADAPAVVIKDQVLGTKFYAAIRAVNSTGQESAFSQEVGVDVGVPSSSTAPILGTLPRDTTPTKTNTVAPKNPLSGTVSGTVKVPGASGLPSGLQVFIIAAAGIGTLLALRRQFSARTSLALR